MTHVERLKRRRKLLEVAAKEEHSLAELSDMFSLTPEYIRHLLRGLGVRIIVNPPCPMKRKQNNRTLRIAARLITSHDKLAVIALDMGVTRAYVSNINCLLKAYGVKTNASEESSPAGG